VLGQNGQVALEEYISPNCVDKDGNQFTGYIQEILARIGFQIGSKFACGCIKNVSTQSNHTLTDDHLASLLELFPTGYEEGLEFYMSRRSVAQLRRSRTTFNPTGQPAPIPDEAFNHPILRAEAISNAESAW
jgi:hypothetical protein